jgi:hypothetical protein
MVVIELDENQAGLIWMAASAKADWMLAHGWPAIQSEKLKNYGLTKDDEQTYHQAIGLAGEAAVHLWVYGNLSRFFQAQRINQSSATGDGGEDLQGINVKAVDSLCSLPMQQNLLVQSPRLSTNIIYLQTLVMISEPFMFISNLKVKIVGAISGSSIATNFKPSHGNPPCYMVPFELLFPPEALLWNEHKRKIK